MERLSKLLRESILITLGLDNMNSMSTTWMQNIFCCSTLLAKQIEVCLESLILVLRKARILRVIRADKLGGDTIFSNYLGIVYRANTRCGCQSIGDV